MIQVEDKEFVKELLQKTGYGYSEILSVSYSDRIVLMRNGGKYKMVDDEIEHLAGPSPDPSERM